MARRCPCLENRILAAFKQALEEGRVDVAEHLLCALEALDPGVTPGPTLSEAYLSTAKSTARHTARLAAMGREVSCGSGG